MVTTYYLHLKFANRPTDLVDKIRELLPTHKIVPSKQIGGASLAPWDVCLVFSKTRKTSVPTDIMNQLLPHIVFNPPNAIELVVARGAELRVGYEFTPLSLATDDLISMFENL